MGRRPRWKFGCGLLITLGLVIVMSCALTGVIIQRRVIKPPELQLALGRYRVMSYATRHPNCPPYGGFKPPSSMSCSTGSLFATEEDYTVWLLADSAGGKPGAPRMIFRRLLALPLQ